MVLSAVFVLVVAQSSSEIPEGLMNNPVQHLFSDFMQRSSVPSKIPHTTVKIQKSVERVAYL